MPFVRAFDDVYASIRDACESPHLLLSCSRADDFYGAGHIMEDILTGILSSDYLVADVTGKNPNVFYELGIAHCCKVLSRVIIISQTLDDVPFDLRHMRCLTYRNDPAGLRRLRVNLERALLSDAGAEYRFIAEEACAFEFSERLGGKDRNFYRFTLDQLHVGRNAVKCALIVHRESLDEGNATLQPDYHYLEVGETAPIRPTYWQLRLDRTDQARAYFTLCRVEVYSQPNCEMEASKATVEELNSFKEKFKDATLDDNQTLLIEGENLLRQLIGQEGVDVLWNWQSIVLLHITKAAHEEKQGNLDAAIGNREIAEETLKAMKAKVRGIRVRA